jgi:NAD(P)-dependent dehydrogenase (short-subunit alcohol dehydrogenase family)
MVKSCGSLWQRGAIVDWSSFLSTFVCDEHIRNCDDLPQRSFSRDADVWVDPPINRQLRAHGANSARSESQVKTILAHPCLSQSETPGKFLLHIDERSAPVVFDHKLHGKDLVPGAFFAEVALAAAASDGIDLTEVSLNINFDQKCFVAGKDIDLELAMSADGRFLIHDPSRTGFCASGRVKTSVSASTDSYFASVLKPPSTPSENSEAIYDTLSQMGLDYGPSLRGVGDWQRVDSWAWWAKIGIAGEFGAVARGCVVNPAYLDMFLQLMALPLKELMSSKDEKLEALPIGIKSLVIRKPAQVGSIKAAFFKVQDLFHDTLVFCGCLLTNSGEIVVELQDAAAQLIKSDGTTKSPLKSCFWHLVLKELPPRRQETRVKPTCIVFCDNEETISDRLSKHLSESSVYLKRSDDRSGRLPNVIDGFDSIVYIRTGDLISGVEDEHFYDKLLQDMTELRDIIKEAEERGQRSCPIWVVTNGTPLVEGVKRSGNPAGAAFWGMLKNLVNEDVLPGLSGFSLLRCVELPTCSIDEVDSFAAELRGPPRDDCAEIILQDAKPMRLELAEDDWSWSELAGFRPTDVPISEMQGTIGFACGRTDSVAKTHVDTRASCKPDKRVDVESVALHPDRYFSALSTRRCAAFSSGRAHRDFDGRELRMLDFKGYAASDNTGLGGFVAGCIHLPLTFGQIDVPGDFLLPWSRNAPPSLSASHFVVAREALLLLFSGNIDRRVPNQFGVASACHDGNVDNVFLAMKVLLGKLVGDRNSSTTIVRFEEGCDASSFTGMVYLAEQGCDEVPRELLEALVAHSVVVVIGGSVIVPESDPLRPVTVCAVDLRFLFQDQELVRRIPEVKQLLTDDAWEILSDGSLCGRMGETQSNIHVAMDRRDSGPVLLHKGDLKASLWRPRIGLVRDDLTYIVTGALRAEGLGFLNAHWLAEHGAKEIVLCGRSRPAENLPLEKLEQAGARVRIIVADVCTRDGSQSLRTKLREHNVGNVGGVFHAAAVFKDGLFQNSRQYNLHDVLWPKVQGALVLANSVADEPLELFVMHSSIVSVTGNWGQASYGAANNFLDAFVLHRRSRGLPGQAINWTSLEGVGVLSGDAGTRMVQQLRETRGFEALDRPGILQSLEAVLCMNRRQLAVATFDFDVVQGTPLWKNPLVRGRFSTLAAIHAEKHSSSMNDITDDVSLPLHDRVASVLTGVLVSLPDDSDYSLLQEQRSLADLGLQSGDAIAARQRMNSRFNTTISLEELLDPSQSVAETIQKIVFGVEHTVPETPRSAPSV